MNGKQVAIIGAGLSGLCCALRLQQEGIPFILIESSDQVGGRVRTDKVDGFLLDRGFQIFLSAYEEASRILSYADLDLKPFLPGAIVRAGSRFHTLTDPFRLPSRTLETILSPVGTMKDKLMVACLRGKLCSSTKIVERSSSTINLLQDCGFSEDMIEKFFRPFLSGIFLDSNLDTESSVFEYVFRMLSRGDNVLPARGMQSIPEQIALMLPPENFIFNARAVNVQDKLVTLSSGGKIECNTTVLATEEPEAAALLGNEKPRSYRSQTCIYFAAENAPFCEPVLVLNGEGRGLVNNFCIPSNVSASYAPEGKVLISAAMVGENAIPAALLEETVIAQLSQWFGKQVYSWKHLRTYRVRYALPDQSPAAIASRDRAYKSRTGVYTCGDYKETGSINGAMLSGRKAAEQLMKDCY